MLLTNQFTTQPFRPHQWEKTEDGFLRVKARVLAERVMPYGREELSSVPDDMMSDVIPMVVTRETMGSADSLRTLEGAQVVSPEHIWVTPDNAGVSKGNTAGSACLDGPYLCIDMIITDPATISDIESGRIGEISAGYHADTLFEPGDFDGQPYLARQTKLRFNHLAVISPGTGRAGEDVRIINKSVSTDTNTGGQPMSTRNIRLKNSGRIVNVDEDTAKALEEDQVAQDTKEESLGEDAGRKFEVVVQEAEAAKAEAEQATMALEEVKGELSVYKEKVDELLSEEGQEAMIDGALKEQEEVDEIIENAFDEEKKEEIKNSLKGLRGMKLKTAILNHMGVKVDTMSAPEISGAFTAQVQLCNRKAPLAKKAIAGEKLMNQFGKASDSVHNVPKITSHQRLGFK